MLDEDDFLEQLVEWRLAGETVRLTLLNAVQSVENQRTFRRIMSPPSSGSKTKLSMYQAELCISVVLPSNFVISISGTNLLDILPSPLTKTDFQSTAAPKVWIRFFPANTNYFRSVTILTMRTTLPAQIMALLFAVCSQWLCGLRHQPSSPARTLRSWVRIKLKVRMSVCVYSV
jgi:hypothetical protein